jgi:DNA polymerase III delta prime subunit
VGKINCEVKIKRKNPLNNVTMFVVVLSETQNLTSEKQARKRKTTRSKKQKERIPFESPTHEWKMFFIQIFQKLFEFSS